MAEWLLEKELQRLVLVIVGTDSGETLERWTFNVHKEDRPVFKDGRWGMHVRTRLAEAPVACSSRASRTTCPNLCCLNFSATIFASAALWLVSSLFSF